MLPTTTHPAISRGSFCSCLHNDHAPHPPASLTLFSSRYRARICFRSPLIIRIWHLSVWLPARLLAMLCFGCWWSSLAKAIYPCVRVCQANYCGDTHSLARYYRVSLHLIDITIINSSIRRWLYLLRGTFKAFLLTDACDNALIYIECAFHYIFITIYHIRSVLEAGDTDGTLI